MARVGEVRAGSVRVPQGEDALLRIDGHHDPHLLFQGLRYRLRPERGYRVPSWERLRLATSRGPCGVSSPATNCPRRSCRPMPPSCCCLMSGQFVLASLTALISVAFARTDGTARERLHLGG